MTRAKPNGRGSHPGVEYRALDRVVLSADEAATYLGLGNGRAVQRLVDSKLLAPLELGRRHTFHVDELNRLLTSHLEEVRRRRELPDA